ncbi:MAG TPA: TIGR00366 family protein [Chthoniobacterales bacterium]|nr:TIGR00366 family protein [Chthoniobacterales bacterium]
MNSKNSLLARLGGGLAAWAERWFPDSFVFALLATLIVFAAGLALRVPALDLVGYFGEGFWGLTTFTLQMVMVVIGGYVVASSPPAHRLIHWLSTLPSSPRGAVALVAFVSTSSSLISYGFSLIFAGFLAREIAARMRGVDYQALGAAAYLGLGSIWALGLSSSPALMMATPSSIPPALLKISGVIPLTQTIYAWQSLATALILLVASVLIAYFSAPVGHMARTADSLGVALKSEERPEEKNASSRPGEWLENKPYLTIVVVLIGVVFLLRVVAQKGLLAALDLNIYNFMFLMLGLALHGTPRSFTRAVSAAVPATSGIIIQFPFYAGIFGIISYSPISHKLAEVFVSVSTKDTYPILVSVYSAILGLFVPSGGGKWLIEAPYLLAASADLQVNLGWTVQIYNAAEALPNLINPFWMLPLLGILGLKSRDLVGYGLLQLLIHVPLVLALMWIFSRTLPYLPPIFP